MHSVFPDFLNLIFHPGSHEHLLNSTLYLALYSLTISAQKSSNNEFLIYSLISPMSGQ